VKTLAEDDLIGQIPAIESGNFYAESDKTLAMASTNPTPLSIPTIVSDFLPDVAKAVEGA
jgi:iron complex transport system substrate-binding protein